jgi:hypothetical protein
LWLIDARCALPCCTALLLVTLADAPLNHHFEW